MIILNHLQTEALMKYGKAAGTGKIIGGSSAFATGTVDDIDDLDLTAYARGTAYNGISAYSRTGGSAGGLNRNNITGTSSGAGANTSTNSNTGNNNNGNDKSTSEDQKATAQHTDSVEKDTEATENNTKAYDLVERRLNYFANATETIANKITDYIDGVTREKYTKQEIGAKTNEMIQQAYASSIYGSKADSVKLSEDIKNAVREGLDLDPNLVQHSLKDYFPEYKDNSKKKDSNSNSNKKSQSELVDEYVGYWDKAVEAEKAAQQARNDLLDLYNDLYNLPIEEADKKIEKFSNTLSLMGTVLDSINGPTSISIFSDILDDGSALDKLLGNAVKKGYSLAKTQNAILDAQIKQQKNIVKEYKDADNTATANLSQANNDVNNIVAELGKRGVSKKVIKQIKSGEEVSSSGKSTKTKTTSTTSTKAKNAENSLLKNKNVKLTDDQKTIVKNGGYLNPNDFSGKAKKAVQSYNKVVKKDDPENYAAWKKRDKLQEKVLNIKGLSDDQKKKVLKGEKIDTSNLNGDNKKTAERWNKARKDPADYYNSSSNKTSANPIKKAGDKLKKNIKGKLTEKQKRIIEAGGYLDPKDFDKQDRSAVKTYNKKMKNNNPDTYKDYKQYDAVKDKALKIGGLSKTDKNKIKNGEKIDISKIKNKEDRAIAKEYLAMRKDPEKYYDQIQESKTKAKKKAAKTSTINAGKELMAYLNSKGITLSNTQIKQLQSGLPVDIDSSKLNKTGKKKLKNYNKKAKNYVGLQSDYSGMSNDELIEAANMANQRVNMAEEAKKTTGNNLAGAELELAQMEAEKPYKKFENVKNMLDAQNEYRQKRRDYENASADLLTSDRYQEKYDKKDANNKEQFEDLRNEYYTLKNKREKYANTLKEQGINPEEDETYQAMSNDLNDMLQTIVNVREESISLFDEFLKGRADEAAKKIEEITDQLERLGKAYNITLSGGSGVRSVFKKFDGEYLFDSKTIETVNAAKARGYEIYQIGNKEKKYSYRAYADQNAVLDMEQEERGRSIRQYTKDFNASKQTYENEKQILEDMNAAKRKKKKYNGKEVTSDDIKEQEKRVELAKNQKKTDEKNLRNTKEEYAEHTVSDEQTKFNNIVNWFNAERGYHTSVRQTKQQRAAVANFAQDWLSDAEYAAGKNLNTDNLKWSRDEVESLRQQLALSVNSGAIQVGTLEWEQMITQIEGAEQEVINFREAQLKLYQDFVNAPIQKATKEVEELGRAYSNLGTIADAYMTGGTSFVKHIYAQVNDPDIKAAAKNKFYGKDAYKGANEVLAQQLKNEEEQVKINRETVKKEEKIVKDAEKKRDDAQKAVEDLQNNTNKDLPKFGNTDMQKAFDDAIKSGRRIEINDQNSKDHQLFGQISDRATLDWINKWNAAIDNATDTTTQVSISQEALDSAIKTRTDSEMQYAKGIYETARQQFTNIKDWHDFEREFEGLYRENRKSALDVMNYTTGYTTEGQYKVGSGNLDASTNWLRTERTALVEDLNKKVAAGTIDVGSVAWQQMRQDILNLDTAIIQNRQSLLDLFSEWAKAPLEKAAKAVDKLKSSFDKLTGVGEAFKSGMSMVGQYAKNITDSVTRAFAKSYEGQADYIGQNKLLDKQLKNQEEQVKEYRKAVKDTTNIRDKAQADKDKSDKKLARQRETLIKSSGMAGSQKSKLLDAINSGEIINEALFPNIDKNTKLSALIQEYNTILADSQDKTSELAIANENLEEANDNLYQSELDLVKMTVENEIEKFNNIKDYYDSLLEAYRSQYELNEKAYELSTAHGNYEKVKNYDQRIANREEEINQMQKEADALQKQLNDSVSSGKIKEGSKEWNEMNNQINELNSQIVDIQINIEELTQQQLELNYDELFERAAKKADLFIDRLETIVGLISNDMMYDKDGLLTVYGALALQENAKALQENINNLQSYMKERQQIIDDFNKDAFGQEKYDELMAENQNNITQYLQAANSSRQAILDIMKEQAQAELQAIQKVIQKRQEALQKKKAYYDYDKSLRNKQTEIQSLEAQVAALNGVIKRPSC